MRTVTTAVAVTVTVAGVLIMAAVAMTSSQCNAATVTPVTMAPVAVPAE
jgi:hypothetical protein